MSHCNFTLTFIGILMLIYPCICKVTNEPHDIQQEIKNDRDIQESWYDEITSKVKESSRQYARDTLRYTVQSTINSAFGEKSNRDVYNNEDDEHTYTTKDGRTINQILNAQITQEDKDKERDRNLHTMIAMIIAASVVLVVLCAILIISYIIHRMIARYLYIMSVVGWFIWLIVLIVKYWNYYNDTD